MNLADKLNIYEELKQGGDWLEAAVARLIELEN